MKVQVEIDIFDDPEYCDMCHDKDDLHPCPHLDSEEEICTVYTTAGCYHKLLFDFDKVAYKKCDQCKAAYHNTKDYSKIKEAIYRQVSGIYCTCGNKLYIGQVSDENETVALFCCDCEIRVSIALAVVNQPNKKG